MAATKQQEREALQKIRAIVDGLGSDSYIGMAFEGCFDLAEENIENDFALSMKQRAEKAEKSSRDYENELVKARFDLEEMKSNVDSLKQQVADEKKKQLTRTGYINIYNLLTDMESENTESIIKNAGIIAMNQTGDIRQRAIDRLNPLFTKKKDLEDAINELEKINDSELEWEVRL